MTAHVSPDVDQIRAAFADRGENDGPVVMLNLNRYRDRATYDDGRGDDGRGDVSGREAYLRYGVVAYQAIEHVGGRILWATSAQDVVIGCDHDRYDEVLAVWYPSRAAFLALSTYPGYMEAHVHRDAALEQATLLACAAGTEPVLTNPFTG